MGGEEGGDVRAVGDAVLGQDVGGGLGDGDADGAAGAVAGADVGVAVLGELGGEVAPGGVERGGGERLPGPGRADEDGGGRVGRREAEQRLALRRGQRLAGRVGVEPVLDDEPRQGGPAVLAGGPQDGPLGGQVPAGGVRDPGGVDGVGGPVGEPGGVRDAADLEPGDLDDVRRLHRLGRRGARGAARPGRARGRRGRRAGRG